MEADVEKVALKQSGEATWECGEGEAWTRSRAPEPTRYLTGQLRYTSDQDTITYSVVIVERATTRSDFTAGNSSLQTDASCTSLFIKTRYQFVFAYLIINSVLFFGSILWHRKHPWNFTDVFLSCSDVLMWLINTCFQTHIVKLKLNQQVVSFFLNRRSAEATSTQFSGVGLGSAGSTRDLHPHGQRTWPQRMGVEPSQVRGHS